MFLVFSSLNVFLSKTNRCLIPTSHYKRVYEAKAALTLKIPRFYLPESSDDESEFHSSADCIKIKQSRIKIPYMNMSRKVIYIHI